MIKCNIKKCGIYGIFNLVNQKIYIGSTLSLSERAFEHRRKLNNGTHANRHLQYSWDKYGEGSFIFEPIETLDETPEDANIVSILVTKEQQWMNNFKSYDQKYGYNLKGAGHKGKTSEETKRKLSIINTGKKLSEEHKIKISNGLKGRIWTIKSRLRVSLSLMNRKPSSETKKKMSEARNGMILSDDHKRNISLALRGNKNGLGKKYPGRQLTEERKAQISKSKIGNKYWVGRKHSEETKRKISEARKRRTIAEEIKTNQNKKN